MRRLLIGLCLCACGEPAGLRVDPAIDLAPADPRLDARAPLGDAAGPAGPPDAGPPDAGPPDAAPPDAAPPDAAPPDAAPPDAAPPNRPPVLRLPAEVILAEEEPAALPLSATDPDGDPLRLWVLDLPPGARWLPAERRLSFTPDFTQGGRRHQVRVIADDGHHRVEGSFTIEIRDTIRPPDPEIVSEEAGDGFRRLRLRQRTDLFLDSPGFAGRSFTAFATVPTALDPADPKPVRIRFHGLGASPGQTGWRGELRLATHDPDTTYWWGYARDLPGGPAAGPVAPYTLRRALHLLDWALRSFPGADPENVYATGSSMGGAGAALFGLYHARHVSYVEARLGQAVPRNHRPSRRRQLEGHWGPAGPGFAWDAQDLTALLRDDLLSRQQFLFLKHGKDDPTIHFGAVTFKSPVTDLSLYEALQAFGVGHFAVWDEGGHGSPDPALGEQWWTRGWNPVFDTTSRLRRNLAFPAFSASAADDDPGGGEGNGRRPFSEERGYAGDVARVGDTGWAGDRAGCLNRALRWDSDGIVDTLDHFEIPLRILDDGAAGSPPTGDRVALPPPVSVDVTLRRLQRFQLAPGEVAAWTFGDQRGEARPDADGQLRVPGLRLTHAWQVLRLTHRPP